MPVDRCCIDISIDYDAWEKSSLFDPYSSWDNFFETIALHIFHTEPEIFSAPLAHLSILLTDNDTMQNLNRQFRDKDKPTNVLSFPSSDSLFTDQHSLGDLAFAFDVIQDEARKDGKTFLNHMTHLTIHGILHLLGYDHITDDEAETMEKLEIDLLHTLNIPNPYT